MRKRENSEERVFFPWERGGGLLRKLRLHRAQPFLFALAAVLFVVFIGLRERKHAGIRHTRAVLFDVRQAMDAYLADHGGDCPENLEALTTYGSFKTTPRDAWGQPLRMMCPGRREAGRYEIFSDGPDGKPGGLDRVE